MSDENKFNEWKTQVKANNEQPVVNSKIKNEDALYKLMAYSGMLEK